MVYVVFYHIDTYRHRIAHSIYAENKKYSMILQPIFDGPSGSFLNFHLNESTNKEETSKIKKYLLIIRGLFDLRQIILRGKK